MTSLGKDNRQSSEANEDEKSEIIVKKLTKLYITGKADNKTGEKRPETLKK